MNTNDKVMYGSKEAFVQEVVRMNGVATKVLVMYWKPKQSKWQKVWVEASEVTIK